VNMDSWVPLTKFPAPTWSRIDQSQLPLLAPAFRLFGSTPKHIWGCGYLDRGWRTDPLDQRWVVDTVDVPATTRIKVGQALIWVGSTSDAGWCLWPPSPVIEVTKSPDGMTTRICTLRDSWLSLLDIQDAPQSEDESTWKERAARREPFSLAMSTLQWWGLYVWCPVCGDLGRPTAGGMTPPPRLRTNGEVDDWREHHQDVGSCVDLPNFDMACPRCGCEWGETPIAEDGFWPDQPHVPFELAPVATLDDLLARYEVDSITSLEEAIVMNAEPDTYAHVTAQGVEIQVQHRAVLLAFPLTMADIDAGISELEDDVYETDPSSRHGAA